MLQDDAKLIKIRDNIENKVVKHLEELKQNDFDKYVKFYEVYGNHLKFGVYSSFGSKNNDTPAAITMHPIVISTYSLNIFFIVCFLISQIFSMSFLIFFCFLFFAFSIKNHLYHHYWQI